MTHTIEVEQALVRLIDQGTAVLKVVEKLIAQGVNPSGDTLGVKEEIRR